MAAITKWYTLKVISGKEAKIKQMIEQYQLSEWQEEEWGSDIKDILLYTEKVYQIKGNKKTIKERNKYPGYLIVEIAQRDKNKDGSATGIHDDLRDALNNLPNVMYFLGRENPTPLKEEEVKKIVGKMDESEEEGAIFEALPEKGEIVKVTDGAFEGFNGVIDEVYKDKKKVRVIVKIFDRETPMELSFQQIDRI